MKKSTLFFFSTLIAVFLSASTSYAYSTSRSACEANCGGTCDSHSTPCGDPTVYICYYADVEGSGDSWISRAYGSLADCNKRREYDELSGYRARSSCYSTGGYYRYAGSGSKNMATCNGSSTPSCPAGCSTCSSSTTCTTCDAGFYLSSGSCLACPANATCNGSSTYNCNSGYLRQGNACVSCPANATCNGSSSFTCNSAYWRQGETCASCPANATCNGSSSFTCNRGYKKSGNACVKDRTVGSCPSRMTLSSDGCCCINK